MQQIFLLQTQEAPRMVVFAGIDHGNGCSRIALSVAETLAGNARGAVCLVEANFHSPALPAMLGTTNHHGLTDALLQRGFDPVLCKAGLERIPVVALFRLAGRRFAEPSEFGTAERRDLQNCVRSSSL